MSVEIKIRKGETVDKALRRLKKKIDREGIIKDARAKRGFEKPAERRRRKKKSHRSAPGLKRRLWSGGGGLATANAVARLLSSAAVWP